MTRVKKRGIERVTTTSSGIEIYIIHGTIGSNIYVLAGMGNFFLVDCSFEEDFELIAGEIERLESLSLNFEGIILTHYHKDHCGCAQKLKEKFGVKISISEIDGRVFEGDEPYVFLPKNIDESRRIFLESSPIWQRLKNRDNGWFPKIDNYIYDGERIFDFEFMNFPGHTDGTMVLFNRVDKILISSDYLVYPRGIFPKFFKSFVRSVNVDEDMAHESTKKMIELDFNILLPGHGGIIKKDAKGVMEVSELYGEFFR
jgi:glyoxylase-like metal-dependent hydrolase (beta-lactamase superfamily II)